MKIRRSTVCSLKFANQKKIEALQTVLHEYGRVINGFIDLFWFDPPRKSELLKSVIGFASSWLSARLRQSTAREAIDMICSSKERDRQYNENKTMRSLQEK